MKSALAFVLAFAIACAASTAAKVAMTKPLPPTADSTKAHGDSTKTDTAVVASGEGVMPATDTIARPVALDSSKAHVTLAGAPAAAALTAAAAPDTVMQASERRLAKVFTSMDAKQAAKVLEHMADGDIQIILGYVGPRQAASILEALPPERVATLSKLALGKKK